MALLPLRNQPISFLPEDENVYLQYRTNNPGIVSNGSFSRGGEGWTFINGFYVGPPDSQGRALFFTDGTNKLKVRQEIYLPAGDYSLIFDYETLQVPITAKISVGTYKVVNLPLSAGPETLGTTFTVPTAAASFIEIEFTFAIFTGVLMDELYITDDSEPDRLEFQVKATGNDTGFLPTEINVSETPDLDKTDATVHTINLVGVGSGYIHSEFNFSDPYLIPHTGKYLLRLFYGFMRITFGQCTLAGDVTPGQIRARLAFAGGPPTSEYCIGPPDSADEWRSDSYLEINRNDQLTSFRNLVTSEDNGGSFDIDVEYSDINLKIIPSFYRTIIVLDNSAFYRFEATAEGMDSFSFRLRDGGLGGTVLFQKESVLGKIDVVFQNQGATGPKEIYIEWPTVIAGAKLTGVKLSKIEAPRIRIRDDASGHIINPTPIATSILPYIIESPVTVGDEYSLNWLFRVRWEYMPPGNYFIELYDDDASPIEYQRSNVFCISYDMPEDSLLLTWDTASELFIGDAYLHFETFSSPYFDGSEDFAPMMRVRGLVYKPTNSEDKAAYVNSLAFVDIPYGLQRTIRELRLTRYYPEFPLLALFLALLCDEFYIDGVRYQKLNDDELAPDWPEVVRRSSVGVLLHKYGEHILKDNPGSRLSFQQS